MSNIHPLRFINHHYKNRLFSQYPWNLIVLLQDNFIQQIPKHWKHTPSSLQWQTGWSCKGNNHCVFWELYEMVTKSINAQCELNAVISNWKPGVLHLPLYFKVLQPESLLLTALHWERDNKCLTSGFRCGVNEICTLLRFYATQNGSLILTFRDNLTVSSSRVNDNKAMFTRILFYITQYILPQLWEQMCWQ
jgi:hypothetical protein